jgi:hypothetical protein
MYMEPKTDLCMKLLMHEAQHKGPNRSHRQGLKRHLHGRVVMKLGASLNACEPE